jgi:transposase InsO family protein
MRWFPSLDYARSVIEQWWQNYNSNGLHGSLGRITPEEFVAK